ncbi:transferase [Nocardia brasiliensis]|uniref:Transferase n=1 Tax=Nocardia brasiliensis TaxID=37326 RepID=A0A6G9XQQ3_NOCBR|nr:transferase [Nocardia brasiliensis]QIS03239.1 transferase [Nocardia brasiliensis]
MKECRACVDTRLRRVLDLGRMPAADDFPPAAAPVRADEAAYPLAMELCPGCGLAQLAQDDTRTAEPRGVEPQALRDQAVAAVERVGADGWLRGATVREFASPHGGSWLPHLVERGFGVVTDVADLVLDCFGSMHEPDQRAAFVARAKATAPEGVLLLQFHSLLTIVRQRQWNALRHGHFAYYSLTVVRELLRRVGMSVATAWEFDLYGGTVLAAAVHGVREPDAAVRRILAAEAGLGDPAVVGVLQSAAEAHVRVLRDRLTAETAAGRSVYAYGAASRAVALFSLAGIHRGLVRAVADAAPAKQGRRMPGTDVPIISPAELLRARPDRVLLTLPDLRPELEARFPELASRWLCAEDTLTDEEPAR